MDVICGRMMEVREYRASTCLVVADRHRSSDHDNDEDGHAIITAATD
jgi:hypothetical protein